MWLICFTPNRFAIFMPTISAEVFEYIKSGLKSLAKLINLPNFRKVSVSSKGRARYFN